MFAAALGAGKGRRTARTSDSYRNISLAHRDPTAEDDLGDRPKAKSISKINYLKMMERDHSRPRLLEIVELLQAHGVEE